MTFGRDFPGYEWVAERNEAVGQFREVEDAVRAISSPLLQSFKQQLVDVLRVNYEVLDQETDGDA